MSGNVIPHQTCIQQYYKQLIQMMPKYVVDKKALYKHPRQSGQLRN